MKAADKRRYERLKAEKRCVRCGAQDERTKAGRTLCNGCYMYDSKKAKLQYKERCKNQCCIFNQLLHLFYLHSAKQCRGIDINCRNSISAKGMVLVCTAAKQ